MKWTQEQVDEIIRTILDAKNVARAEWSRELSINNELLISENSDLSLSLWTRNGHIAVSNNINLRRRFDEVYLNLLKRKKLFAHIDYENPTFQDVKTRLIKLIEA